MCPLPGKMSASKDLADASMSLPSTQPFDAGDLISQYVLAHLWRSRGTPGRAEYLRLRDWVSDAVDALGKAGSLTPAGKHFVELMLAAARDDPGEAR